MRIVTIAGLLLVTAAGAAQAQKGTRAEAAVAAAEKAIDKMDAAYNAHDGKTLAAMLDKGYIGAGPFVGTKVEGYEASKAHLESEMAAGGRIQRQALTVKADDDGDTAWYIADYLYIPKVPPGALPMRKPMREAGVLVRRGKEWKLAMSTEAMLQLAPRKPAPPPGPTAPRTAPTR